MRKSITKTTIIYSLFFLLFIFCCFQNIIIYNFNGMFSFKVSHLIAILFLPLLLKENKIKLPPTFLTFFFIFILLISCFLSSKYKLNSLLFNYIAGFYYLILFVTLGSKIEEAKWLEMIKKVSWIVLIAVLIKLAINIDTIIQFIKHPSNHPIIDSFFGGGVNLEATWVALLGFSFYKDKKGYVYWLFSMLIAALYASRVGMLASGFLFIYLYLSNGKKTKKELITSTLAVLTIGIIGIIVLDKIGMLDYMFTRFLNIGSESGSLGRLNMWKYVLEAFNKNPFGYGIGNSIIAIRNVSNLAFAENNLHNLFLQMLLDLGLIGFLYYIVIIFKFIISNRKKLLSDPIIAFLFVYIILSLFQFRGGDSIMFCFLGIYLIRLTKNKEQTGARL